MVLRIETLRVSNDPALETLALPQHSHPGDAGLDLRSDVDVTIKAGGGRTLVSTGIAVAIPDGYAGFIHPRSGLAYKYGVTVLNAPGLIDSGYRGELKVLLVNTDPDNDFVITRGERIAQLVIQSYESVELSEVDSFSGESIRGEGGFGSTGK